MLNLFQPGTGSNVLTLCRTAIGGKTSSAHVRAKHVIQHPVAIATVKSVPNKGAKRPMGDAVMPCCSDSLLSLVMNWSMHVEQHASSCWTMGVSQHCRRLLTHSAFTFPYLLWVIYWYGIHACIRICMMHACMCLYHVPLNTAIEPRCSKTSENCCQQWRIQNFPGDANSKDGCEKLLFGQFFPKNCMKLKTFGLEGGVPGTPLDPSMVNSIVFSGRSRISQGRGSAPRGGGGRQPIIWQNFGWKLRENEAPLLAWPPLKQALKRVVVNSFMFDLAFKGYCLGKETANVSRCILERLMFPQKERLCTKNEWKAVNSCPEQSNNDIDGISPFNKFVFLVKSSKMSSKLHVKLPIQMVNVFDKGISCV